jgi:hypothetical protein
MSLSEFRKIVNPRVRINNDVQNNLYGSVENYDVNGNMYSSSSAMSSQFSRDVMTDHVTPHFRERIRSGEVINNPMNHEVYTKVAEVGESTFSSNQYGYYTKLVGVNPTDWQLSLLQYRASPTGDLIPDGPEYDLGKLVSLAKLKALEQIDASPYNFMEDLAEIQSTIHLLRNPLSDAKKLARTFEDKFYRLRRKDKLPSLVAFSNAWLSVRYGFRPIVLSLLNAHSALDIKTQKKPVRRVARGIEYATSEVEGDVFYPFASGSNEGDSYNWNRYDTVRVKANIIYEAPLMTEPLDLLGLRGKMIPRTAYNLLAYSWVVDRFVNLGANISALMNLADPRIRILGATYSINGISESRITFTGQSHTGYTITTSNTPSIHRKVEKVRMLWHPTVGDAAPIYNPRIDGQFAVDLTSLVLQRMHIGSFDTL